MVMSYFHDMCILWTYLFFMMSHVYMLSLWRHTCICYDVTRVSNMKSDTSITQSFTSVLYSMVVAIFSESLTRRRLNQKSCKRVSNGFRTHFSSHDIRSLLNPWEENLISGTSTNANNEQTYFKMRTPHLNMKNLYKYRWTTLIKKVRWWYPFIFWWIDIISEPMNRW